MKKLSSEKYTNFISSRKAFQDGFASAQKKHKNDFLYGFYTGIVAFCIVAFLCLTCNFYM